MTTKDFADVFAAILLLLLVIGLAWHEAGWTGRRSRG